MAGMANAYALVVGIGAYEQIHPLPESVGRDAQAIYDVLVDPQCCGYRAGQVQLLMDGAATQAGLRQVLVQLAQRSSEDSTVFIYVSGRGGWIDAVALH